MEAQSLHYFFGKRLLRETERLNDTKVIMGIIEQSNNDENEIDGKRACILDSFRCRLRNF
jgi:hypothetical protein